MQFTWAWCPQCGVWSPTFQLRPAVPQVHRWHPEAPGTLWLCSRSLRVLLHGLQKHGRDHATACVGTARGQPGQSVWPNGSHSSWQELVNWPGLWNVQNFSVDGMGWQQGRGCALASSRDVLSWTGRGCWRWKVRPQHCNTQLVPRWVFLTRWCH